MAGLALLLNVLNEGKEGHSGMVTSESPLDNLLSLHSIGQGGFDLNVST